MLNEKEQSLINQAIQLIESKAAKTDLIISSATVVKSYCQLKMGLEERENFAVLFLNTQNELISYSTLFKGTIDQAAVYPREIAKKALDLNAKSLILAHNHPSGSLEPSSADVQITKKIVSALSLLDIQILDHVIVSPRGAISFAEKGLL